MLLSFVKTSAFGDVDVGPPAMGEARSEFKAEFVGSDVGVMVSLAPDGIVKGGSEVMFNLGDSLAGCVPSTSCVLLDVIRWASSIACSVLTSRRLFAVALGGGGMTSRCFAPRPYSTLVAR